MQERVLAIIIVIITLVTGIIYVNNGTLSAGKAQEESKIVITLGQDLNELQREQVMKTFEKWKKGKEARFITVSNAEERKYLQGKIDNKLIGSKAISSAYCELLDGNSGVEIETENITSITPFMYANALTTAGVEDARVLIAAPFEVSGTAALTGIIKAFEVAKGEKLNINAKETAYQELTETYKLSSKYGKNSTENMIYAIKRQVIENDANSPQEIRQIILDISNNYNISLTPDEIQSIIVLMQRYQNIRLDTGKIDEQLQNLNRNLAELNKNANEENGILQKIISFFKSFLYKLEVL